MNKKEHSTSNKNKSSKKTNKTKESHKKTINNLDLDIEALKQKINLLTNIEDQEQEKEEDDFKEVVSKPSFSQDLSPVPRNSRAAISQSINIRPKENLEQHLTPLQLNNPQPEVLAKEQEQQIKYSSFNPNYNESTEEIFRKYEAGTSRPNIIAPTLRQREIVQSPAGIALTRTEILNPLRSRGIQSMSTEREKIEAEMRQTQMESVTEKEFREKYKRVKF